MFCKECGVQLPDNAQFCRNCGNRVQITPAAAPAATPTPTPSVPQPASPPPQPAAPITPAKEPHTTPKKSIPSTEKNNSNIKIIAITALVTLLLVCLVVVISGLFTGNNNKPSGGNSMHNGTAPVSDNQAVDDTMTPTEEPAPTNPLSPSNPYREMYNPHTFSVLEESDSRYYVRSEVDIYSADILALARNEILARHGYVFSDSDLAEYFGSMPWYCQNQSANNNIYDYLNEYETANVALLRYCQDRKEGKVGTVGNGSIYLAFYDPDSEYILPMSNRVKLENSHLQGLSKDMLCVARNEIFARRGYTFSDKDLMVYFSYCSWYRPTIEAGRTDLLGMSDLETENVEFIRSYEKDRVDLDNLDRTMNYTISCDMFSVTLPAYWKICAEVTELEDGGISFREKLSFQNNWGGLVFSLYVMTPEDANDFWGGMGQKVGRLTNPQGETFYLVQCYPTDVQYEYTDPYISAIYSIMCDDQYKILDSIYGINGWSYSPMYS